MWATEELKKKQIIGDEQKNTLDDLEITHPLSIHWELRVILYLGVTLLSTGLGILIYKNIDTIGHHVIIALNALACTACFWYIWKHKLPFHWGSMQHPSPFYDYVLLLGVLLLGILTGYIQYQYEIFGTHYGLATLLPSLAYLFLAYRFDHKGVLSLSVTGLAAWAGISVSLHDLLENNFDSERELMYTGIAFGICTGAAAWFTEQKEKKKHFAFTFHNFAANIFFIAALSGLFSGEAEVLMVLLIAAGVYFYIYYARKMKSFIFLLYSVIYGYIMFSYLFILLMDWMSGNDDLMITLGFLYFMASAGGVVLFFIHYKKLLGIKK
ncbi:MAG: DUF2157 domain-containing protein [Bacteroidia bacterium]|nr:DUF2157 domain-containing protein [Bacteroidia bacterium]